MRVGFPLVLEGKAVAVWVDCRPIGDSDPRPVITWDETPLAKTHQFYSVLGKNPALNAQINEKISELFRQGKSVFFSGINLPSHQWHEDTPRVVLEGNSYGLTMHLASRAELLGGTDDTCVLLSGGVNTSTGTPESLGVSSATGNSYPDLYHKWRCAHDGKYPLLLLKNDFDRLRGHLRNLSEKGEISSNVAEMEGSGNFSSWDNFKHDFDEWVKAHGCGRAYPLPIVGRYWTEDNSEWDEGLSEFLGLRSVSHNRTPNAVMYHPEELDDAGPIENSEFEMPANAIGQIYKAALSNEEDYLVDFLRRNKERCLEEVYPGGMLEKALELKKGKQLFYSRDHGSGFDYRHIVISGPTAGGKTFLAEALLLNCAIEEGLPAMLIAPTRALVNEIYARLLKNLESRGETYDLHEKNIIRSTGEYSQDDHLIRSGNFKIALVVSEKANIFMQPEFHLTENLGLLVIDELHMLAHPQRGGVIDLLIAKARKKRKEKADRRHHLRIAVISTEPDVKKAGLENVFRAYNYETFADDVEPLCLSVEKRPFPVKHNVVLYAKTRDYVERRCIEVMNFAGQSDRLRPEDNHLLKIKRKEITAERNRLKNLASDIRVPPEVIIMELVNSLAKAHRKVLVVSASKSFCLKLALRAKNIRKDTFRKNGSHVTVADISLPSGGVLSTQTSSQLRKLAACGLYLHHADIPRVTREEIERIFREDAETSHPEIVFATETLSYGVNLLADCVIILGLSFPRTDIHQLGRDPEFGFLTATEYHNILGRAGRSSRLGEAYVLLSSEAATDGDIDALLEYYQEQKPFCPMTFSKEDIAKAAESEMESLDDISYEAFRSVMDALRTAAGRSGDYATVRQIFKIIEYTVFWSVSSERQRENAKALIERTLEVAADYQNIRLIEATDSSVHTVKKYRILPQAEALIDTGTRWTSVAPMRDWLETLKNLHKDPIALFPVSLIVPAFISTQDFWTLGKSFCIEAKEKKEIADIGTRIDTAWNIVRDELSSVLDNNDVAIGDFRKLLDEFIKKNSDKLSVEHDQYRLVVFYKLFAALLLWIRGAALDDIDPLSVKGTQVQQVNDFSMRYTERAAWLAVMCYRFFGTLSDMILPEHLRELPQLAQRLRIGLPSKGLPFYLENDANTRSLDRDEIMALLDAGLTAPSIVSSKNPHDIVARALKSNDQLIKKAGHIIKTVFNFYKTQMRNLSTAFDNESAEAWSDIRKLYNDMLSYEASKNGVTILSDNVKTYNKALNSLLRSRCSENTERDDLKVVSTSMETVLTNQRSAFELRLRCLEPDEEEPIGSAIDIVVYIPWRRGKTKTRSGHFIEMTSFAALAFSALVGRRCILTGELTKLKKHSGQTLTVADIVTMFPSEDMDVFTERLLEIVEMSEE